MDGQEYSKKELSSNIPSLQNNSNKYQYHSGSSCASINNPAGGQYFISENKSAKIAQVYISGQIQTNSI